MILIVAVLLILLVLFRVIFILTRPEPTVIEVEEKPEAWNWTPGWRPPEAHNNQKGSS